MISHCAMCVLDGVRYDPCSKCKGTGELEVFNRSPELIQIQHVDSVSGSCFSDSCSRYFESLTPSPQAFVKDWAELALPLNFKKFSRSSGLLAWFSRSTAKRRASSFTRSAGDRNAQNELCQRTRIHTSIQLNIDQTHAGLVRKSEIFGYWIRRSNENKS